MWSKSARADVDAGATPFGINLAIGAAVMIGATVAAAALAPEVPTRLVVMSLAVVAVAGLVKDTRASLVVSALGYLLFTGFLVNRYGELSWDGTTSAWHLAVFALSVGLGRVWRWIRTVSAEAALIAELSNVVNQSERRETQSTKKETHDA